MRLFLLVLAWVMVSISTLQGRTDIQSIAEELLSDDIKKWEEQGLMVHPLPVVEATRAVEVEGDVTWTVDPLSVVSTGAMNIISGGADRAEASLRRHDAEISVQLRITPRDDIDLSPTILYVAMFVYPDRPADPGPEMLETVRAKFVSDLGVADWVASIDLASVREALALPPAERTREQSMLLRAVMRFARESWAGRWTNDEVVVYARTTTRAVRPRNARADAQEEVKPESVVHAALCYVYDKSTGRFLGDLSLRFELPTAQPEALTDAIGEAVRALRVVRDES